MSNRPRPRTPRTTVDSSNETLDNTITRAQHGDEHAFRQLYRTTQPRLLNYLKSIVGENDAEDLAGETWASIARDLPSFEGDSRGFQAWASTIARHRATDHLRRNRPVTPLPHNLLPHHPTPHDTASQAHEAITTHTALALIAQLPIDQAQTILLRIILGLDATTTAQILDKQPGAIRTATYRGLHNLRRLLIPDHDPAPQNGAGH